MKINRKDYKKIGILLVAVILIVISFIFFNKAKDNKINADNKNKSTISTEELKKEALKKEELEKSNEKASSGDSKAASGNIVGKATTADNKTTTAQQAKDEIAKAVSSEESFAVFVKAANFGTTAQIVVDSSNFKSSYKYYQYFLANEPISKVESISNKQTTIFPAQKAGSEVVINLMSENKKVLKKLNIKLNDKK